MNFWWTSLLAGLHILAVLPQISQGQDQNGPQVIVHSPNVTAKEGGDVVLPCSVVNLGDHQVLWRGPKNTLSVGKRMVSQDKRFQLQTPYESEWNMYISKVRSSDSGFYSCFIRTTNQRKSLFLQVHVPPSIMAESLSNNYEVLEGTRFSVTCQARGIPRPTVKWLRVLKPEPHNVGQGETLEIPSIKRSDDGDYFCEASNNIEPKAVQTINVIVRYPPKVTIHTKEISQYLGKETMLLCIVDGSPIDEVTWSKGSQVLQNSWKYKLTTHMEPGKGLEKRLSILGIELSDGGVYQCLATNKYGTDEGTSRLKVLKPMWTTVKTSTAVMTTYKQQKTTSRGLTITKIDEITATDKRTTNGVEIVTAKFQYRLILFLGALTALL